MTGPDHHAEMEAHYAAGMERQEAGFLFDDALAEAKERVEAEIEREGYPPAAMALAAIGVGAGIRVVTRILVEQERLARQHLYEAELRVRALDVATIEGLMPLNGPTQLGLSWEHYKQALRDAASAVKYAPLRPTP